MKVDLINAYKEVYKEHLRKTQSYNELYKYECLKNFQDNWDLGTLDLGSMYEASLTSKLSARLWGGSQNSAKEVMLLFIEKDKEFVRSMFRDLYKEEKDVGLRVNRFLLHCDELLRQLQLTNKKLNAHYHTLEEVALYLAFNDPQKYCLRSYGPFSIMMERLGAKNPPQEFEIERYFKLCKGLYTMLSKDPEVSELLAAQIAEPQYYQDPGMLMVHDYLVICSQETPL